MTTPLGDIEICIDGKTIKYTAQNMGVMDRLCLDVEWKILYKSRICTGWRKTYDIMHNKKSYSI